MGDQYTANKRKYADEPALQGFKNQEEMYKAGYFNKNFASAKFEAGLKAIATGEAAHYPMLTGTIATIEQNPRKMSMTSGCSRCPPRTRQTPG